MSEIHVKAGVIFKRFTPALIRMLGALDSIALSGVASVPGLPDVITITSANDGKHAENSRHYKDEALDVRSKNFPTRASKDLFRMQLGCRLGPKFTVLLESEHQANEHLHVQVRKNGTYP